MCPGEDSLKGMCLEALRGSTFDHGGPSRGSCQTLASEQSLVSQNRLKAFGSSDTQF